MVKLSVFCGVSVDGFLARPDDALDFLREGEQEPHGFTEFMDKVDVVVLGRRTFDVVMKLGHLELYGGKQLIVLSSHDVDVSSAQGKAELMWGEPAEIVARLDSMGFRHAYVDGGITIRRFLAAGLVDRLVITRVPVLIGAGIPLFGPLSADIKLHHVQTRVYNSGMVQSEYKMAG